MPNLKGQEGINNFLLLNPNCKISKIRSILYLYSRDFSEGFGVFPLSPIEGIILANCDGTKTYEDIIALANELIKKFQLTEKEFENLKIIIAGFIKNKIILKYNAPQPALSPSYRIEDFLTAQVPQPPPVVRLEVPIGFGLIVTQKCTYRCKYCYARTKPVDSRKEPLIPLPRLEEILSEARGMGIESIAVSGGEPFLHPEILQIIGVALKLGIFPAISTKSPLSRNTVSRLAKLGLKRVQISLDSAVANVVDKIVGEEGYFPRIMATIKTLIEWGIQVRVNCVLIKDTVKDVYSLCEMIYRLGVRQLGLAPYSANLSHFDSTLFPSREDYEKLRLKLDVVRHNFPDLLVRYPDPLELEEKLRRKELEWCPAGKYGFAVRPDGKVTICEQLTQDDFVVGDLNHQSINDVWNSKMMLKFRFPHREFFQGTQCFSCDEFEDCSRYRGRCYLRTLIHFKRIFAPDPFCPRLPDTGMRFKQW